MMGVDPPVLRVIRRSWPQLTIRRRVTAALATAGVLCMPGSASVTPHLAFAAAHPATTSSNSFEGESYDVDTASTVSALAAPSAPAAGPAPYGVTTVSALTASGIPVPAHTAYVNAAAQLAQSDPSCGIQWSVLAGIGRVESNHGRFGGSAIGPDGVVRPAIIGIRLDGSRHGTAVIRDSDAGRYDGDPLYDRAIGPMQFLPRTWEAFAPGSDPQDMNAAALAAGRYLCHGDASLATPAGRWAAVYRYNHSDSYVSLVLSLADSYATGRSAPIATRPAGTTLVPDDAPAATSPGQPPSVPVASPGAGPGGVTVTQPGTVTAPTPSPAASSPVTTTSPSDAVVTPAPSPSPAEPSVTSSPATSAPSNPVTTAPADPTPPAATTAGP